MSERARLTVGDEVRAMMDEEEALLDAVDAEGKGETGQESDYEYDSRPLASMENIHFESNVYNSGRAWHSMPAESARSKQNRRNNMLRGGAINSTARVPSYAGDELAEPFADSGQGAGDQDALLVGKPGEEQMVVVEPEKRVDLKLIFFAVFLVCISSSNDVAGQVQAVVMGNFAFFLGIFNGFAYTLVYFIILTVRLALGWTDKEQLKYAWYWNRNQPTELNTTLWESVRNFFRHIPQVKYFVALGFLDGIGTLMGLIAKPHITGDMAVLIPQTSLLFIVIVSMTILGTKYTLWQLWSVLVVLFGVILSIYPKLSGAGVDSKNLIYIFIMALAPLSSSFSFVIKEKLFTDFKRLHRTSLDVFIVNSHGSLFQLLLQPAIIPLAFLINPNLLAVFKSEPDIHVNFSTYLYVAFSCFGGINRNSSILNTTLADMSSLHAVADVGSSLAATSRAGDCSPMPYPYLIYIAINLTMNISFLFFVRHTTALMSFMTTKATIPLSICLFYLNWPPWEADNPIISANTFSWFTISGLVVILFALMTYRMTTMDQQTYKQSCCSVDIRPLDLYLDGLEMQKERRVSTLTPVNH